MNNGKNETVYLTPRDQNDILFSEYMIFCQYADTFDFNNYFRLEELSDSELCSILDFLYHEDCYLMLQDLINKCNHRLLYPEETFWDDIILRNDFDDRLEQILSSQ